MNASVHAPVDVSWSLVAGKSLQDLWTRTGVVHLAGPSGVGKSTWMESACVHGFHRIEMDNIEHPQGGAPHSEHDLTWDEAIEALRGVCTQHESVVVDCNRRTTALKLDCIATILLYRDLLDVVSARMEQYKRDNLPLGTQARSLGFILESFFDGEKGFFALKCEPGPLPEFTTIEEVKKAIQPCLAWEGRESKWYLRSAVKAIEGQLEEGKWFPHPIEEPTSLLKA